LPSQGDIFQVITPDNSNANGPNGLPVITRDITITTPNGNVSQIESQGDRSFRVFYVAPGAALHLNGIMSFGGNLPTFKGGALYNDGGTLTLTNSDVDNGAALTGGGIYNAPGGILTISAGNINSGALTGGGCIANAGTATVTNSTLFGMIPQGMGSCILNNGTLTLVGGYIQGESTSPPNGPLYGAVANTSGHTMSVTNGSIIGKAPGGNGGDIYNQGTLQVTGTAMYDSGATNGTGVYNDGGSLILDRVQMDYNRAFANGGALYNTNGGQVRIQNGSQISGFPGYPYDANQAINGGAIYNTGAGSTLTIDSSHISYNTASNSGGAIYNDATLKITNSVLAGNTASNAGAIDNEGGTLLISNSTVVGNSASSDSGLGGGIENNHGLMTITTSTISGNTLTGLGSFGGGVFNNGPLNIGSTIVAGNQAANGPDISSKGGNLMNSLGHNLIENPGELIFNGAGDLANVDPLLGPLADNGGLTQTLALPDDSPAYQHGDCSVNATINPPAPAVASDERGQSRKTTCDIGAFEETFAFNPNSLANGVVGVLYAQTISGSGGTGPYTFQVTTPGSGLPPGITLDASGALSGTPTGNWQSAFTVTATDSSGKVAGTHYYGLTVTGPTATWTVNVNTDNGLTSCQPNNGAGGPPCELRDALTKAGNGDTITFATGANNIIYLNYARGALTISASLTIVGPGASHLAIDRDLATTANFDILTVSSGITVSISGLTIRHTDVNGYSGRGIYNSGDLTLSGVTISGNLANGIAGGGIFNSGTLIVRNSTVSGNSANSGGGVYNSGSLSVSNSTFSGNSADSNGGAIFNRGYLVVANSTLSGNVGYFGGGIYGTVELLSSIVAGNNATGNTNEPDIVGTVTTLGYNLVGIGNGATGITNGINHDQVGMQIAPLRPLLGPLANNGGVFQTLALSADSPAYQTGNCSGNTAVRLAPPPVPEDQRGQNRKTKCDIGAFEETFTFAPTLLPAGDVGVLYPSTTIAVSGGAGNYTYAVTVGWLSEGMNLSTDGLISGTPIRDNTYNFTVAATDSSGIVGSYSYTIVVRLLPRIDSIGVFRSGTFYLRLHNSTGSADITVAFGPGAKPYPIVGDWLGQGFDTVGVYDQSNGLFSLCTANATVICATSDPVKTLVLGNANDMPLSGRWLLSTPNFGVGVFRPSNGLIYLKNNLITGFADETMVLGLPGDVGLAGDWTGKAFDSPGVFRPSNSSFYLTNQVCNCNVFADINFAYGIGSDAPVIGDWTGLGRDGAGLFRLSNGYTYLKNALTTGFADVAFIYGIAGDVPVAGHWQSSYPPGPGDTLAPGNANLGGVGD
jgi:hypothetical protein